MYIPHKKYGSVYSEHIRFFITPYPKLYTFSEIQPTRGTASTKNGQKMGKFLPSACQDSRIRSLRVPDPFRVILNNARLARAVERISEGRRCLLTRFHSF